MTPKTTPMLEQYLALKGRYPDALLFYRMGDFYEMFFEDAEIASRALEITLTSRNKNDPNPVPMCGVPYRAVQSYLARLIAQGHKVAICDQVEDPAKAKGLVRREVTRVVTPGMVVENEMLEAKEDNFLMALVTDGRRVGLSVMDISTGTFRVAESTDTAAVADEIRRVAPREVLLPEDDRNAAAYDGWRQQLDTAAVTDLDPATFDAARGRRRLLEQFGTVSLEGFGCETMGLGLGAAGALLRYVTETQKQDLVHLDGIVTYHLANHLIVDALSAQNLELERGARTGRRQGSFLSVIDRTVTAMGGRRLLHWVRYPLLDPERIRARQDAVADALAGIDATRRVREALGQVHDLERLSGKIALGRGNARDLLALKVSLQALPDIGRWLNEYRAPRLHLSVDPAPLEALAELLETAVREDALPVINEGGLIKEGYNAELDGLIHASRDGKGVLARLETQEREATGIASLKVRYNKVFGYFIEVPKAQAAKVPLHYVRRQTLVNAERYITEELKDFESRVLGAEERRSVLEAELFADLVARVTSHGPLLRRVSDQLAAVDCLLALAEVAVANDYRRPAVTTDGRIAIVDGRHPVVERTLRGERFVPNTVELDNQERQVVIITGPNMAGKSTVLRQVALMVLMTQMGSFIPAREASVGICDRIFTRVGALDNLAQGQSTFMVEMQETANILHHATGDSLVIMDEIGRGTSTFDGLSIAWAVAEALHDLNGVGVKTLFATHYHELTELARLRPRVHNGHITVKEWNDEIIFLRKLVDGGTNRSYGIQVARLAGIPSSVIRRAKKILFEIENGEPVTHLGRTPDDAAASSRGGVQMALFHPPDGAVVEALRALDVTRMTPIEALNALYRLQKKLSPDKNAGDGRKRPAPPS